jgi:hypothetical protein
MASSSSRSRAADRRRQRAVSTALAATDADDAVDVNNGTDDELRNCEWDPMPACHAAWIL